jgi:hypothetical protein
MKPIYKTINETRRIWQRPYLTLAADPAAHDLVRRSQQVGPIVRYWPRSPQCRENDVVCARRRR